MGQRIDQFCENLRQKLTIHDSAIGWDGTDPIRPFPDLSKI
jgi:hypothetical protein